MTQPNVPDQSPTFASLAADLRAIADVFEKAPHVALSSNPWVKFDIQPDGTDEQIIERTDAIGQLLFGKNGEPKQMGGNNYHYKVDGKVGLIEVGLYDAISVETVRAREVAAGGLAAEEAELARLRAEAAKLAARIALAYSREADDPTPVSPARGGPVHTGAVVAGGELVDETGGRTVPLEEAVPLDEIGMARIHLVDETPADPTHYLEPGAGDGETTDVLACGLTIGTCGDGGYATNEVNVTCQACRVSALIDETPACTPAAERRHPIGNGTQKVYRFDNNYGASVVQFRISGMDGSYGASKGLWELAVLQFTGEGVQFDPANWELTYETPITCDVIGGLGDDEVQEILAQIRDLPASDGGA